MSTINTTRIYKVLVRVYKFLFESYKKSSYSQSGEDLIVKFIFNALKIKKPSYLDIGAHHPYYISNTALLYESGSRGINIEPDPVLFKKINKVRKKDTNLNFGIGEEESMMDFYIINTSTLSTFSRKEAESYTKEGHGYEILKTIPVQVRTLNFILNQYFDGKFPDFLSLDVEGMDELIIKSIDYEKCYPTIICVETISFSTSGNGIKNKSMIEFLDSKGYMVYADTNINTIFVREDKWKNR